MRFSIFISHFYEIWQIAQRRGFFVFWERFYNMCTLKGTKPNPLAKEIGISSGIVTKWKTIGTLPNGETLVKIADYLNCSVDYLLGRTDNPEYANEFTKEKYNRLNIQVPKGQKAIIEQHWKAKGYKSLNAYVNDLIRKDMEDTERQEIGGGIASLEK